MGCCCSAAEQVAENFTSITILGLPNAGKTSIVETLAEEYDPCDPPVQTSGIVQRGVEINGNEYLIYDVCGYSAYRDDWNQCISKSVAVIIVFDPIGLREAPTHAEGMVKSVKAKIVEMDIPTLFIVNKVKDDSNGQELENLVKQWGESIKKLKHVQFGDLDRSHVMNAFEWIESYIVE